MTDHRLLDLVDARDFRALFIDELGWDNPDRPVLTFDIDGTEYALTQVAGYKGLRIWHCPVLPPRAIQRQIDVLVGKDNLERLVIFTDDHRQEWRWPRRAQLGSTNAKLVVHQYHIGDRTTHLADRLKAIELDFDEDLPLVALLERMRDAFDREAETASVAAARLMGTLYTHLETAGVGEHDATLLLARLLFLLFGDDADMWKPPALFENHLRNHTTPETLHTDLLRLFDILDKPENQRDFEKGDPLSYFRYINGGLFHGQLRLPQLPAGFRSALLEACAFNWSIISPAVFGSMFQTVKSREARRHGGEHYTTEENILKTIGPLFLDEYRDRLERAGDDKGQLTKLHNDLAKLRFLDPACGCGNFLIVAYRELRALELEILKRRRDLDMEAIAEGKKVERAQLSLDVTSEIKITLDHFFGIEIEEWPARIAETAMLLVDHLANQQMAEEFGEAPDRLPIAIAPTIVHANALHTDWASVVTPSDHVVILGNPPFIGQYTKTAKQTTDTKAIWGPRYNGYLDYVTCWYAKAIDFYGTHAGRWAYVSTNSICQGEPVEFLWRPILEAGWRCRFAHRSFQWVTEATGGAAVHVSIVGFDRLTAPTPVLWTYSDGGRGEAERHQVPNINPYLCDAINVLVSNVSKPLSGLLPQAVRGSQPTDGGYLLVSRDEHDDVVADPVAAKYLRRFVGARELVHDMPRWCLWLENLTDTDKRKSPVLTERIAQCAEWRRDQPKSGDAFKYQDIPHLFRPNKKRPSGAYLAIPRHVGEGRRYFTARPFAEEVITGDANFMVADGDGFVFGILSSSMFIAWMRAIGGRIKSDLRFSSTFVYNTFPLPPLTTEQRQAVTEAAAQIIASRDNHPGMSLADLYDPARTPADVVAAHDALDRVIDSIFGIDGSVDEVARQQLLFKRYAAVIAKPSKG
ncbi:N-6 DNA Methylase [Mycobacteroides abscessus subsp. massiliense]|uniref:class I SAM-dependent DNA methyltransferase n=1 Tax=Mycobacteroides abscessus TaxID=36809 RepID=UPI0009A78B6B|nr:DNA methyltransferase [Mycobacteroides abscessus]SKE39854.1 N-6 DNA Methylase [Mycobacteroides abscessus subsp. massiliense]SKE48063.1 N-6 DNA Methylase [Mycobacteroides abscessus subsp. massiliense]SKG07891.1 N-6 DNA Methylase [Mycobacteroides abscessus subsp. massiliense]SKG25129.1 N-6 DNA Methylase [Mycobacteroides abscessus subsp. massiliense]SKG50523.1 N-6 DNA Methylase [Mycobacteroides abscessus subsp. massiliense]